MFEQKHIFSSCKMFFNLSFDRMKIEQKLFPFAVHILVNGQLVAALILIQIKMTAQNRDNHGISLVDLTAKNKQDKESIFNWIVLVPKYAFFKIRSCMKMINFFNLSIFWGGRVHRVPSLTYHGNVFNVITGLLIPFYPTKISCFQQQLTLISIKLKIFSTKIFSCQIPRALFPPHQPR